MTKTSDFSSFEREVRTDEIRQIQMMMLLFSCIPAGGKLHEILDSSMKITSTALESSRPLTDASSSGIKRHLESIWVHSASLLSAGEQALVSSQADDATMRQAVLELSAAESKLGFKFKIECL